MSTIKTKMGFDIKPYTIPTVYFRELFTLSTHTYGQLSLLFAILLSVGNMIYLKSLNQHGSNKLDTLQQEAIQIKKRYETLSVEYDTLSSKERLETLMPQLTMQKPTHRNTLRLPQRQLNT